MGSIRLKQVDVEIRQPENSDELEACQALRWDVLRAPWGQPRGSERDELEDSARHYLAIDTDGRILATGRIHSLQTNTAQIRYMAVRPGYERQGLGTRLLTALESDAACHGEHHVTLHARENTVVFYQHRGYRVIRRSHRLFDVIQHFEMGKELSYG